MEEIEIGRIKGVEVERQGIGRNEETNTKSLFEETYQNRYIYKNIYIYKKSLNGTTL